MPRPIRPKVQTVADNPIVQVNIEPSVDEVDINRILGETLQRFEFGIGTSFDLQFLNMDGTQILALQRFIVSKVVEEIVVSDVSNYQTMTKSVFRQGCEPLTDLIIFDEEAEVLRDNVLEKEKEEEPLDLENLVLEEMGPPALQKLMKRLTGRGFGRGVPRDEMVKAIREQI